MVVAAGRVVHHQRGVEVVAQRPVWVEVLVVTMVNRMGHLVRQPIGLAGPLGGQRPHHGLQQQTEQQDPGGEDGFHKGGFYRRIPDLAPGKAIADGLNSSIQHGLTDDAPDMPDGPVRVMPVIRLSLAPLPATPWVFRTRDDPLPVGLDRPPQRTTRA